MAARRRSPTTTASTVTVSSTRTDITPGRGVLHTWVRESSRTPAAGGRRAQYEILLYTDGTLSCDCPGWTQRAVRSCKHTKEVAEEAQRIFAESGSGRRPRATAQRGDSERNTNIRGRERVAAPEPESAAGTLKRSIDF